MGVLVKLGADAGRLSAKRAAGGMMNDLAKALRVIAALTAPALAATDGTLGPTSTGTFTVTATIPETPTGAVRVSGASDLVFPTINAQTDAGDTSAATPICLFHSSPTFSLQVSQPVSGFLFEMTGPGDPIPFLIGVSGLSASGRATAISFVNGGQVTNLISNRDSETCATGPLATLEAVRAGLVPATQANGVYTATVSIIMAVE